MVQTLCQGDNRSLQTRSDSERAAVPSRSLPIHTLCPDRLGSTILIQPPGCALIVCRLGLGRQLESQTSPINVAEKQAARFGQWVEVDKYFIAVEGIVDNRCLGDGRKADKPDVDN